MTGKLVTRLVGLSVAATLRSSLRRVCWVGEVPAVRPDRPVIVYSNHHHFLDGHLLWLAARTVFERRFVVWMEDLDRYPFFASVGALPFPADDPAERTRTVRLTRTLLAEEPRSLLTYFPGGSLGPPESGLPEENPRTFRRLGRIMPPSTWLPVAIHVTWWGESKPTALLCAGEPSDSPPGDEMARLRQALATVRAPEPRVARTLLEGRRGPNERWDLSFLRRFFLP